MIGEPTQRERPKLLPSEKEGVARNYGIFRRGSPLNLMIFGTILVVAFLAIISGWIQKWLWMRQVGYSGVFWTLFSVRWGLFGAAFVVALLYLWINLRVAAKKRLYLPR